MTGTIQFTQRQARFIYLFKGLAPVATSVVTPLMVRAGLRNQPLPDAKKRDIVMQEVARQVVSASIGLMFYFGGGAVTRKVLNAALQRTGRAWAESTRQVLMIVGATAAEFAGYGFVRPLLGNELIVRWLRHQGLVTPEGAVYHTESQAGMLRRQSDSAQQKFWNGIQARSTQPDALSLRG